MNPQSPPARTSGSWKAPVIVLADGDFPAHPQALQALESAGTIVCCDGAAKKLYTHGKLPDYIVGDLDSLSEDMKKRFADRLYYFPSQETNDLTKAVDFCQQHGIQQLTLLGAGGLREDHTLANISLLAEYARQCEVEMLTNYGRLLAIRQTTTFSSTSGQHVSIFTLTPDVPVTLSGLKYPLHNALLDAWWKGSLNETTDTSFTIRFGEGGVFIVFIAFQP